MVKTWNQQKTKCVYPVWAKWGYFCKPPNTHAVESLLSLRNVEVFVLGRRAVGGLAVVGVGAILMALAIVPILL